MVAAIKQGNEFAYEQAFLLLRSKVYGYFLKKTQSAEDARDLVQITFLKLWQYRQSLNEDYSLEQHVFNISRTVFIDYLRRQQKVQTRTATGSEQACFISEEFDLKKQVYQVLDNMPVMRKQVFELHRFQGFSYAEIASRLSITVKSVDNHVSKAASQLKKALVLGISLVIVSLF